MRYRYFFTEWFDRNLKSLRKRNPHLRSDLESFLETFDAQAYPVISDTGGARKARMKATGRGKSGGYRVIYYLFLEDTVWLITIYDKVQKEDLSLSEKRQIRNLIRTIEERGSLSC